MFLRILVTALVVLAAATAAWPRFAPEVVVEGNRRTRLGYLRALVYECLEAQGAESLPGVDVSALEQCVIDSELFSELTVRVDSAVRLTVEERWTLIPVPFVQSQQGSTRAGLFLIESNFLGLGKLLVTGATVGSRGNTFLLVLRDPGIGFSDWTGQGILRRADEEVFRYHDDERVAGFVEREEVVRLQPGYRWTPYLTISGYGAYVGRHYGEAGAFVADPEDYTFGMFGLEMEYDRAEYRFYFRDGYAARLRVGRQFARSDAGSDATAYRLEAAWEGLVWQHPVLKVRWEGEGTSSSDLRDSVRWGGQGAVRGVPQHGLWARHAAGLSADLQMPLWQGDLGTWAAGPFAGYARYLPPEGGPWRTSRTVGVGLFLYLKKIAVPGLGVAAGYNPDFSGGFLDFQIGFGF